MSKRCTTITLLLVFLNAWLLSSCQAQMSAVSANVVNSTPAAPDQNAAPAPTEVIPSPEPTRPHYPPGELVDYTAQAGDTLPALAIRFNTSVAEIRQANSIIPDTATTMPPGMPMKIPIYYLPLWGSSYRIIPDSQFVYGPASLDFDTNAFVAAHPGWLNSYIGFVSGANRTGAQIVDLVAQNFSVSPRLLLALLEYQANALSSPEFPPDGGDYALGYRVWDHKGLYLQLTWAANLLNNGVSNWRIASVTSMEYPDGSLVRFDPWLNAVTVSLLQYFNQLYSGDEYNRAVSPVGLAQTFKSLFGDPWQNEQPHIPASLTQPDLRLPFESGQVWAFTGGPHTGWGSMQPFTALDFAPPATAAGCIPSNEWATAVADGVVVRSELGVIMLDLDGDGDERTGWNVLYLHLATSDRAPAGLQVKAGDHIGHPSCEGGTATGTHIHIARKYNGEWMPADGVVPFNLEGWIAHNGGHAYEGSLTRLSNTIEANSYANSSSFIEAIPR